MSKFIIERNIPNVGQSSVQEMKAACSKSNDTIEDLSHAVQWQQSYVTKDKLYCVYLAKDQEAILEHAAKSGFPADKISRVNAVIDPSSAD